MGANVSGAFQDAGSPFSTVDVWKAIADKHELRLRIWMMLRTSNDELASRLDRTRTIGAGDDYFTVMRRNLRALETALGCR